MQHHVRAARPGARAVSRSGFRVAAAVGLLATILLAGCGGLPTVTGDDIAASIQEELNSVNGAWSGMVGQDGLTIAFNLTQGSGGALTGSGTMKETPAASPVPITVTGTFNRPALSLTFKGMVVEGVAVEGTLQAQYTTLVLFTPLRLVGTGYDKTVQLILSED